MGTVELVAIVEQLTSSAKLTQVVRYEVKHAPPELRAELGEWFADPAVLIGLSERGYHLHIRSQIEEVSVEGTASQRLRALAHATTHALPTAREIPVTDLFRIASKMLRPARPQLAEVLAPLFGVEAGELRGFFVRGSWRWTSTDGALHWAPQERMQPEVTVRAKSGAVRDASEYWELLNARSIVPDEWMKTEQRFFLSEMGSLRPSERWPAEASTTLFANAQQRPSRLRFAASLASNVADVEQAEALAREVVQRLGPFGCPLVTACYWRPTARKAWNFAWPSPINAILEFDTPPVDGPVWERARTALRSGLRSWAPLSRQWVEYLMEQSFRWQRACEEGSKIGRQRNDQSNASRERLRGTRFRELANPFEPLLQFAALGYDFQGICTNGLLLGCPDL